MEPFRVDIPDEVLVDLQSRLTCANSSDHELRR